MAWGLAGTLRVLGWLSCVLMCVRAMWFAFDIRLFSIRQFGPVIHEFDPHFNYRAAEHLAAHGVREFFRWFDHASWYPLGRPVGTTIYPGPQLAAVGIWHALRVLVVGDGWSLVEVCCYIPAWFGVAASAFVGLLAAEASESAVVGVLACYVMAIVPAHASRSVGGGFDNESIAIAPMCAAFNFWCRALRQDRGTDPLRPQLDPARWSCAVAAGVSYAVMAASWGGYVFAVNLIAAHAAAETVLRGWKVVHVPFSLFFLVGTALAMQVPVVGWTPLRSLEHALPMATFVGLQMLAVRAALQPYVVRMPVPAVVRATLAWVVVWGAALAVCLGVLVAGGGLAPASARVRALFGAHATRTGNPLVDSVSEHQPATPEAYQRYLQGCQLTALAGFGMLALHRALAHAAQMEQQWTRGRLAKLLPSPAAVMVLMLACAAYVFSLKMNRLILFLAAPAAVLTGVCLGVPLEWALCGPIKRIAAHVDARFFHGHQEGVSIGPLSRGEAIWMGLRVVMALLACALAAPVVASFHGACYNLVQYGLSHPQIVSMGQNGVLMDDYRESYLWLRHHTPHHSRVLAWWDYGYQISAIANRTTLADGNTWNQDHIALLGLILSSPMEEAHALARHVADFVLVWAHEDEGKSSHMARISNSVFKGHCYNVECHQWFDDADGRSSAMKARSLIWQLVGRAPVDERFFRPVFTSTTGAVRIYAVTRVSKKSRAWAADAGNRRCDAPGSWFCPGTYPPALVALLAHAGKTIAPHVAAAMAEHTHAISLKRQCGSRSDSWTPGDEAEVLGRQGLVPAATDDKVCQGVLGLTKKEEKAVERFRTLHQERLALSASEAPKPNSPGLPLGSYLDSCQGCSLHQDTLTCTHCNMHNTAPASSALVVASCAGARVDNIQGSLRCSPRPNALDIPQGGYQHSCLGCAVRGGGASRKLECTDCETASGGRVAAGFELARCPPPYALDNNNGNLVCNGPLNPPGLPPGSYLQSCLGCRMDARAGALRCDLCMDAQGRQMATVLPCPGEEGDESCRRCANGIGNQNGQLVC